MKYRAGLNEEIGFGQRLEVALRGARQFDLAVAYAKVSGAARLLSEEIPAGRAVVGLGFGLTDPPAVEQLAAAGMDVKCVVDADGLPASRFHPKLYLAARAGTLTVLSGSADLTSGGMGYNVEQYEEFELSDPSAAADQQRERFERIWQHGTPLIDLRRSGDWDAYRGRARSRRLLERENRQRLLRIEAATGRLLGGLARRQTRAAPSYVGITDPAWWSLQIAQRDISDIALFWRRNTNRFRALDPGGIFFHLVRDTSGVEDRRSIRGFSHYRGQYEVADGAALWRRYVLAARRRPLGSGVRAT